NIGWINFDTAASLSPFAQQARYDAVEGRFRGYAWGENVGWINLDDADRYVASGQRVTILAWRSVRTHAGDGPLGIPLHPTAAGNGTTGPTTEPRLGGIQRIEVDFDAPVTLTNAGAVTVIGRASVG